MASFKLLTKWTNLKVTVADYGPGGVFYHDLHPFSVRKIRQYIGLYFFHGLTPSTHIENNFKPHQEVRCMGMISFTPHLGLMQGVVIGISKPSLHAKIEILIHQIVFSNQIGRCDQCSCG